MRNKELIANLRGDNLDCTCCASSCSECGCATNWPESYCNQAADALELADKRIAELEAERNDFHMGYRMKCDKETKELERKLGVAREALKKAEHTHECKARRCKEGDEWIDETKCDCCIGKALAQIGGDDAGT